jgi:hypothetical protein
MVRLVNRVDYLKEPYSAMEGSWCFTAPKRQKRDSCVTNRNDFIMQNHFVNKWVSYFYSKHKKREYHSVWWFSNITLTQQSLFIRTKLTLSGQLLIYNRNRYPSAMDKCWYMINRVYFAVLRSYFVHTSLVGTVCYTNVFRVVFSASSCHLEAMVWTSW